MSVRSQRSTKETKFLIILFRSFSNAAGSGTTILHLRSLVTNLSEVNDSQLPHFASSVEVGDTELVGRKLTRNRGCIRENCSFIGYFFLLVFCFRFVLEAILEIEHFIGLCLVNEETLFCLSFKTRFFPRLFYSKFFVWH